MHLSPLDRYFDKKSSNHHLEDSMSKYSSKGLNNYGNCNDSSYGKHRRNCSPNNGSNSRSRSGSPDSWSPNRSTYGNKSSYSRNKDRERERDRQERDSRYYENKKKIQNCRHSRSRSRSPLESKQSYKSVNNHSSSHDMINDQKCSANRIHGSNSVGDWSKQKSSSGKKYYYNHKTQVSQWEKPKEWIELERRQLSKSERHSSHSFRDNRNDKSCVTSSNSKSYVNHDLSSGYREKESARTKLSGSGSASTGSNSNSSIRSHSKRDDDLKMSTERSNNDSKRQTTATEARNSTNCVKRESLKSPNVASNESSNTVCNKVSNFVNNNQTNDVIKTQVMSNSNNYSNSSGSSGGSVQQLVLNQILSQQLSPTQTQSLQKLLLSSQGLTPDMNFPEETLKILQQALHQLTAKATDQKHALTTTQISQSSRHRVNTSPRSAPLVVANSESPVSTSGHSGHHHRHHHHIQHHSHYHQTQQPHHQSADSIRQELDLLISRAHINKSPVSEKSVISSTRHDSPPSSVANISSAISSASLKPSVPTLTPTLANFYREDLVSHVTGWQADHAEKQAKLYSNQSHDIGSHQCTRVSAELKMARSLVRLTEIQSTLQEQRILFATQQIKNVEDWRGQSSHSSYHS